MKIPHIILVVLLSCAVAIGTIFYLDAKKGSVASTESVYDRVLKSGVLHCGYAEWPPLNFVKDPTTGKMSGIAADVMEAVAAKLSLKIDWAENTGYGGAIDALRDHRVDANARASGKTPLVAVTSPTRRLFSTMFWCLTWRSTTTGSIKT